MSSGYRLGRRSLLKLGTALLTMPVAGRRAEAAGQVPAAAPSTALFAAQLVPAGADCRLALVCDHHYWPEHRENWGGGAQMTSLSDRKMPDLAEALNAARPDLSIHAGDVISAAGSFFPTAGEYTKQLAFARRLYGELNHPHIATVGNHETLDAHYASHDQLQAWREQFGAPYREHDCKSWRFLTLNSMLPNPGRKLGRGDSYGNYYGLDDEQLEWLGARLADAAGRGLKAVIVVHVPPSNWINAAAFEGVIVKSGCVKAVLCGHWHRNNLSFMGGIPVLVRISNVETPFGYSMVHLYPDGRIIVVQESQHFPAEEFVSAGFAKGKQGAESDRYLTLGGASQLPLTGMRVLGDAPRASIVDGHLSVASREGRATVLIDGAALGQARLTLTAIKAGAEGIGAVALASEDGKEGVEAVLTSRYSPDGKVMLVSTGGARREVLARSWFNIADDIAYRLTLECRDGRIRASWKNMLDLECGPVARTSGHFGFFVERGSMYVTDVRLERLG